MAKNTNNQKQQPKSPAPSQNGAQRKGKGAKQLPVLLEVTYTFSALIVILVGIVTAALSVLAGCPVLIIALRSGAAILGVGLAMWLISYCLTRGSIQANHTMRVMLQQALENEPAKSTVERSA